MIPAFGGQKPLAGFILVHEAHTNQKLLGDLAHGPDGQADPVAITLRRFVPSAKIRR